MKEQNKQFYERVGSYLRQARLNKGYTYSQVSQLTGRAISTISDNERGVNDIPFSVILQYCDIYDISVDDLPKE